MKNLFWKEWRENLRWALIGGACVLGAMFYCFRSDPNNSYNFVQQTWQSLCSPQFLLVTSFGFPILGGALGFLQILTELKRDQWAFLVHRPVTRNQIFWGKALPGVILYLIATVIPLCLVGWWVSQPGVIPAPFDWRLIWPGLLDAVSGLGFYFAALWSGILQGRWYGRRAIPLIVACSLAVSLKGYDLITSCEAGALALFTIALASWAAFLTFGSFRKLPWWGKATAALAYLIALAIVSNWVLFAWNFVFPPKPYTYTQTMFTTSGEMVKVTREGSKFSKVVTMDGKELPPPKGKESFEWEDFLNQASLPLNRQRSYYYQSLRSSQKYFQQTYSNEQNRTWYFDLRTRQLVVYDIASRKLSGILGPDGYVRPPNPPEKAGAFSINPNGFYYQGYAKFFSAENALFKIDLSQNSVVEIFHPAEGEKLLGGSALYERNTSNDKLDYAVSTDKAVSLFSADEELLWSFPQPEKLKRFSGVGVSALADKSRYFLLYSPEYNSRKKHSLYVELSPPGEVLKQETFLEESPERTMKVKLKDLGTAAITPFGRTLWEQILYPINNALFYKREYRPIWKTREDYRNYTLIVWATSLLTGLAVACATIPLRRRIDMGRAERRAWFAFLVFYGLAGLLVYLALEPLPRRLRCPHCSRKRSTERTSCEHCDTLWPKPERDGTEIFEKV